MNKLKKYLIIAPLIIFLFLLFAPTAKVRAITILEGIKCAGEQGEACSLDDFVRLAINLSQWILGITGSLALLAFIYGGLVFLFSGGSSEKVNKGKQILIGAILGLVIVFVSYSIINFVLKSAGYANVSSWYTVSQ